MSKKNSKRRSNKIETSDNFQVPEEVIIPPKFSNKYAEIIYFNPRYVKVLRDRAVEWVNFDNTPHELKFYPVSDKSDKQYPSNRTFHLLIKVGARKRKIFDFEYPRIDYICQLHKNEVGTVIIYPKPENQMSNTEQLRFLSKIFNIKPTRQLAHLGSS